VLFIFESFFIELFTSEENLKQINVRKLKTLEKNFDKIVCVESDRHRMVIAGNELNIGIEKLNDKVKVTLDMFNNKNKEFYKIIQSYKNKLKEYKNKIIILKKKIDELHNKNTINDLSENKNANKHIYKSVRKINDRNLLTSKSKNIII